MDEDEIRKQINRFLVKEKLKEKSFAIEPELAPQP